jgi:hypothetical protein
MQWDTFSVSLFIASILVGHLFLCQVGRACLSIFTIPIVIFKNAVRIATIAWLGVYVDEYFPQQAPRYGGRHSRSWLWQLWGRCCWCSKDRNFVRESIIMPCSLCGFFSLGMVEFGN